MLRLPGETSKILNYVIQKLRCTKSTLKPILEVLPTNCECQLPAVNDILIVDVFSSDL